MAPPSPAQGPHLIVVPLSVLPSWMAEFEKWSPQVGMGCTCKTCPPAPGPLHCLYEPHRQPRAPISDKISCLIVQRVLRPQMRVVRLHTTDAGERARLKREVLSQPDTFDVAVTTYDMCRVRPHADGAQHAEHGGPQSGAAAAGGQRRLSRGHAVQPPAAAACHKLGNASSILTHAHSCHAAPRRAIAPQSKEWGPVLSRMLRWRYLVLDEVGSCKGGVGRSGLHARHVWPHVLIHPSSACT